MAGDWKIELETEVGRVPMTRGRTLIARVVRINGRRCIDLRRWVNGADGRPTIPTAEGFAIAVERAGEVVRLVEELAAAAGVVPALDSDRLLDVADMVQVTKLSDRTIRRLAREAEEGRGDGFPKAIRVGPRALRWRVGEVQAYLKSLGEGPRP